eukprot:1019277-Amphidinium_carterae.2
MPGVVNKVESSVSSINDCTKGRVPELTVKSACETLRTETGDGQATVGETGRGRGVANSMMACDTLLVAASSLEGTSGRSFQLMSCHRCHEIRQNCAPSTDMEKEQLLIAHHSLNAEQLRENTKIQQVSTHMVSRGA